jgi:imidazolonepropionase
VTDVGAAIKQAKDFEVPEPKPADRVFVNARVLTLASAGRELDVLDRAAIVSRGGRIVFVGDHAELPGGLAAHDTFDCGGRLVTPGLIDCHTHLVYAGDRAHEFELRLNGATYQDIAAAGGGIMATVHATRAASEAALVEATLPRLDRLIAEGVTTVEIKSGYGLSLASELKQLRAARALAKRRPVSVTTTFLGAHALPPEANGDRDAYIDCIIAEMLPAIAASGLADAVDAFCESIAFTPAQTSRLFQAARNHSLPVKLHADQLSNLHGARLAAEHHALSADHLEYTDAEGAAALAKAGSVAVLLPGAFYVLREKQQPPIDLFRREGVAMALATDCNPGTSPLTSLLLVMNMAATLFRMTVGECLAGVTREAARALGQWGDKGSLEVGKFCDLAIWDVERPAELVYRLGFNPLHTRIWRGS